MKRHLLFVVTLLLVNRFAFGQETEVRELPYPMLSKKESAILISNHSCVKKTNKSLSERLKNYPFNQTTQIQLVSFRGGVDSLNSDIFYDSLPRMNDTVCYSKLIEIKKLRFSQVDRLSNIFYNYGYKKVSAGKGIGAISLCYFPRNAILFLDTTGTVFEYIEICFECNRTKESSSKVSLGEMCSQKMELLKDFFSVSGIEYGITKGLMGGD